MKKKRMWLARQEKEAKPWAERVHPIVNKSDRCLHSRYSHIAGMNLVVKIFLCSLFARKKADELTQLTPERRTQQQKVSNNNRYKSQVYALLKRLTGPRTSPYMFTSSVRYSSG